MSLRFLSLLLCAFILASCESDESGGCQGDEPTCTSVCGGDAIVAPSCVDGAWTCDPGFPIDAICADTCAGTAPSCVPSCSDGSDRWPAACSGGAWACTSGVKLGPDCDPDQVCVPLYPGDRCEGATLTCHPTDDQIRQCPDLLCSTCRGADQSFTDALQTCMCECPPSADLVYCLPISQG